MIISRFTSIQLISVQLFFIYRQT